MKLTGDGVFAKFPSAVDALTAAVKFQKAMAEANGAQPEEQRIVFRVGLHLGDLIVDGDDLYGNGINVAARLQAEATPGEIVVSGALVEALVLRRFDYDVRIALPNETPRLYPGQPNPTMPPPAIRTIDYQLDLDIDC